MKKLSKLWKWLIVALICRWGLWLLMFVPAVNQIWYDLITTPEIGNQLQNVVHASLAIDDVGKDDVLIVLVVVGITGSQEALDIANISSVQTILVCIHSLNHRLGNFASAGSAIARNEAHTVFTDIPITNLIGGSKTNSGNGRRYDFCVENS